jgi:hypothetical protein
MLRPATPALLERLLRAVHDIDLELDTALTQLGVLPPLDLSEIRSLLSRSGVQLAAAANPDGHRVIRVSVHGRPAATIEHDGRLVPVGQSRTLATA